MTVASTAKLFARFFEIVSYVFTVFEWLWLIILLLPLLITSGSLEFFLPNGAQQAQPVVTHEPATPLMLAVGGIITILMIVLSAIALWRLPKTLANTGNVVTHKVTEVVLPVMTHHKPISKKKRRMLSVRVMFYVRLSLVLVPFVGVLFSPSGTIDKTIVVIVAACIAIISVSSLAAEQLLTYRVAKKQTQ